MDRVGPARPRSRAPRRASPSRAPMLDRILDLGHLGHRRPDGDPRARRSADGDVPGNAGARLSNGTSSRAPGDLRRLAGGVGDGPDPRGGVGRTSRSRTTLYLRNAFEKAHAVAQGSRPGGRGRLRHRGRRARWRARARAQRGTRGRTRRTGDNLRPDAGRHEGGCPARAGRLGIAASQRSPLADGRELHAEGTCEGTLASRPRGRAASLRPVFVPAVGTRTMAELELGEKDRISHRFGLPGAPRAARGAG